MLRLCYEVMTNILYLGVFFNMSILEKYYMRYVIFIFFYFDNILVYYTNTWKNPQRGRFEGEMFRIGLDICKED